MLRLLGIASGVLAMVAAAPYVWDTLRGHTRPQRMSWLIWSILGLIAFGSQLSAGWSWGLAVTVGDTLATVTIFALSLGRGEGGSSRRDFGALGVALVGLVLWGFTQLPAVALTGVIIADLSGAALTIVKAYREPQSETLSMWVMIAVAGAMSAVAVGRWDATLLAYPVYLSLTNGAVGVAIWLGRRRPAVAAAH
ncbi:MAG TPA: hypothetical protein VHQ86_00145 [Candidatus Saccharimonadia bacterium]|jgi:hypothetical protein|nr:hypothetical protein [Candidatus Saccharimonadia bacterium]